MASGTWISWQSERSEKNNWLYCYFRGRSSALAKVGCKSREQVITKRAHALVPYSTGCAYTKDSGEHWRENNFHRKFLSGCLASFHPSIFIPYIFKKSDYFTDNVFLVPKTLISQLLAAYE